MAKKKKISGMRGTEKMSSELSRLLEEQGFKSVGEMQSYLKNIAERGEMSGARPRTAVQLAQDIMYEAWEEEDPKKRITLAKEALSISTDCADAYNLLAEENARTLEDAADYFKKGMEAGRRALGEEIFKEYAGHFWGFTQTRPYMRSRAGHMQCLWEAGSCEEALAHAREMLELNPHDNQGIRYILSAYLAELGRYDELNKFLNESGYKEDCSAEWLYTRALVSFVEKGDSEESREFLREALKANRYAPEYLSGLKPVPRFLPDSIAVGGEDEGFCYASRFLEAWEKAPGAIAWLKGAAGISVIPKAGRNEPCPCGSGKKHKKCCGA